MADNKDIPVEDVPQNEALATIDPLYQKYVKSVLRALGSTQFYRFFMDSLAHAQTEIQFSNRRLEKIVDVTWIDAVENALNAFNKVVSNPRNVIREDELIVNVANAKKAGSDTVRHLAMHASLVEDYEENSGDVRPSKLMQKYREDSLSQLYENRLAFTVLEHAFNFVKIRHDALLASMGDEFGAKLKVTTDMDSTTEAVHMDTFIHIRDTDDAMDTDEKNREVFDRISRLYRVLSMDMNTHFARHMSRYPRVKGTVTKTNVLKKDPNYHAIMLLWDFFRSYDDVGYTINVVEQNPVIDEAFQRDIYHNILFNYLVLKGHLERDKDRTLPAPLKEKKRALKPKFIKEIIEELTEDYDLPDVEIRKVLIEELTKEQLMKEEAAERRRLVEEQAQRKKEEAEKARQAREAEKERLKKEREAERERIRQEKAAEAERLRIERLLREQEDRRRSRLFKDEVAYFWKKREAALEARLDAAEQEETDKQDFEDAAYILEETERLKKEEAARERQRRRDEWEKKKREELLAQQQARREEEARREAARQARLAEEAQKKREEEERQAQLLREEEARRERERLEAEAKDRDNVRVFSQELESFRAAIVGRMQLRKEQADAAERDKLAREAERQARLEALKNAKR